MNKILITGGAGFIGSHLTEFLSRNNYVTVIDNLSHGNKIQNLNKNIKLIKGDVKDKDLLNYYSKNCKSIFHLAAVLGVDVVSNKNVETMNCEFEGIKNICEAAKKNKIKKIIYSSSSGVYGKLNYSTNVKENATIAPVSAYSISKRACEFYLKSFYKENKITSIAVRLFNVYGPRQDQRMVVSRFIEQAKKNKPITIYGSGKQTRDFTFIDDCVKVFDLLNKKVNGFQIINSSKGKDLNILNLAKKIKKDLKSQSKIVHIEIPEKLEEFQVPKRCGSSSKLNKLINYKPNTSFVAGLSKTINSQITE
ncbi:MAG: NAD-dependent epimerase/dehydratase family protein [Pelagibacterales bacterium]|nr:NAD-dependent epimerase/dehydratase family protein [Pelagibacterales bacterium]